MAANCPYFHMAKAGLSEARGMCGAPPPDVRAFPCVWTDQNYRQCISFRQTAVRCAGGNAFDEYLAMGHPRENVVVLPGQRGPSLTDQAIDEIISNHLKDEPRFLIGTAHIFVEGGGAGELGAEILRLLQPRSYYNSKNLTFHIHKASIPWPTQQQMIVDIQVVLFRQGIRLTDGGESVLQFGAANGKRFYAIYVPHGSPSVSGVKKVTSPDVSVPTKRWWQFWKT